MKWKDSLLICKYQTVILATVFIWGDEVEENTLTRYFKITMVNMHGSWKYYETRENWGA